MRRVIHSTAICVLLALLFAANAALVRTVSAADECLFSCHCYWSCGAGTGTCGESCAPIGLGCGGDCGPPPPQCCT